MNDIMPTSSNNLIQKKVSKKRWFQLSVIGSFIVLLSIAGYFSYQQYNPGSKSPTNKTSMMSENNETIIPPVSEEDKPMKLAINEVKAENGKLHAVITIENRGNLGFEKLLYSASLVGQSEKLKSQDGIEILAEPTPITRKVSDPFALQSGMVTQFSIDLDYPKGASEGEYTFVVEVQPLERISYARETQKINLTGDGPFLKFPTGSGCKILANNATFEGSSPNINPNEQVSAQCDVENTGNETTTAKPIIKYADTSTFRNNQSAAKTIDNLETITLKPNEKKTINFTIPAQSKPQSYDAHIHMIGEDNLPISNFGFVRYSIIGPSATIQTAELSSSDISKGDPISLTINAAPSADLFYNGTTTEGTYLKQPKLSAQITSASTVCAQKMIDLPANKLSWEEITMEFTASAACPNPLITINISEAEQELASFQKQYSSSPHSSNKLSTLNTRLIMWIVLITVIIVIITVISILIIKKKKIPNNPVTQLLIFFAATALFFAAQPIIDIVSADIVIPAGGSQVTVVRGVGPYWVSYNTSSAITYNGSNNIHVYFGATVGAVDRNWYMSDRVRIWVNGSLQRDYVTVRSAQSAPCACQGVDHHDDISVSTGQHNVEARIYAVQWSNSQFLFQADSGMTDGVAGDQDSNNCGSNQACYGRLGPSVVGQPACTPASQTRAVACAAGYSGTQMQQQDYTCPGGTWGAWYNISAGTTCTPIITQVPPPSIQLLGTDCNYSQPRVLLRLTASPSFATAVLVTLSHSGGTAYQVNLNPGQAHDVWSTSFNAGYTNFTPNQNHTFSAVSSSGSYTPSTTTSLPVFIPNCPSPPAISYAAPECNGSNYQPYNNIGYQYSTYGNPTAYHLDRKPFGQAFASHGDGYIGTYAPANNPIQDYGINNNTAYSYRMRADNGTYQSTPSTIVNATSRNCTPPTISASARCIDNLSTPEYTINVTSNANVGRDMWYTMNLSGYGKLADVYMTGPNQVTSRVFTSPPITNGTVHTFSSNSWHSGIATSYTNYVSLSVPDCSLPRTFNISTNTNAGAVCPAQGLPKLNVNITKSANATTYELYTYERDGSGNYTIPVPAARRDYTSNELFPGAPIVSNSGTATRSFDVLPNKSYGVFVVARNSTGSWIYSNMATAMTAATPAVWAYANLGWCDTTPPTVQLSSLSECYQPNQLPANMQLTIVDSPAAGAPANSVSNVNPSSVRFLMNALSTPAVVQEFTHQNQSANTYSRLFTSGDFTAVGGASALDRDYELAARACDYNNNCTTMNKVIVSYAQVCGAWIQTRQGNVHSEKEINAPGGPY